MSSSFSELQELYDLMVERCGVSTDSSYTAQLLSQDVSIVARKFGEESIELLIEAIRGDSTATVSESADVLYHLLALWLKLGVSPEAVMAELKSRQSQSGLQEKANR